MKAKRYGNRSFLNEINKFSEPETYSDYGIVIPHGRMSGQIRTHCPNCSSQRKKQRVKCLGVNLDLQIWNCSHCLWKGRLKSLNKTYIPMKKEYKRPEYKPKETIHSDVEKYFLERKITPSTLKDFKIGYGSEWMPQTEKSVQTIQFNYFKNKELVNIKYRTKDKHFKLFSGGELIFYNLDSIKGETEAIITEGEIGALTWHEIGFKSVISVPNGSALSKEEKEEYEKTGKFNDKNALNLEYLDNCWNDIKHIEKWYIATDNDAPGRKLQRELVRRLGADKCYLVNFGQYKDENEILCQEKDGRALLKLAIEKASQPEIEGVSDIESEWEYMVDIFENGKKKGLPIGINEFNEHFSLKKGELTIVNGYPGDGKTSVVLFLMLIASIRYGWKWAVFSPENYPVGDLYDQLIEMYIGKSSDRDRAKRMSFEEYQKGKAFIGEHFFAVDPDTCETLDDLLNVFELLVKRKGINGALVDPWNDLIHVKENGENEHDYLMRRLRQIRQFKRRLEFYFFVNHHPVTIREKDKEGAPIVPTAYHLSGGSMWRNRADNIMTVYRPRNGGENDLTTEIHVQKIKFHKLVGRPTNEDTPVKITYEPFSNRFRGAGGSTITEFAQPLGGQEPKVEETTFTVTDVQEKTFEPQIKKDPVQAVCDFDSETGLSEWEHLYNKGK